MSKMIEQECENCGGKFKADPSKARRFCSRRCGSTRPKTQIVCGFCGKIFDITPYQVQKGTRYCSVNCRGLSQRKTIHRICESCGKDIYVSPGQVKQGEGKFCSRECRTKKVSCVCAVCGKSFCVKLSHFQRKGNKYCSRKCYDKKRHDDPKTKNYYGADWPSQRYKTRKRDKYTCQCCGATNGGLDVHHKIPFKKFGYIPGKNDNYKQANDLSNLVTLCFTCHKKIEKITRANCS